jgi:hypothetical protein
VRFLSVLISLGEVFCPTVGGPGFVCSEIVLSSRLVNV